MAFSLTNEKNKNKIGIALILFLLMLTSFLRLYRIDQLIVFNYDQARDALYTKRLVADHKFRLVGPQSSPGFYTGPAYYYVMAPFLWLTGLNPVGMDLGVAIINIFTVLILFFLLKKTSNSLLISFVLSLMYSIQPQVVWQSRFSWNPNITPFFSVFFILGLLFVLEKKTWGWIISLVSLGFLVNLHFTTLCLVPMILFFVFLQRKNKVFDRRFLFSWLLFFVIISPFLIMELRHNFPNMRYFYKFLTEGPAVNLPSSPLIYGIWAKSKFLFVKLLFGVNNDLIAVLIIFAILAAYLSIVNNCKNKQKNLLFFYPICFLILMSALYRFTFFEYYLTFLYPMTYGILGIIFSNFLKKKTDFLLFLIFVPLVLINIRKDINMLKGKSVSDNLQEVASVIASDNINTNFNIVGVWDGDRYDHNGVDYRYFLETFYNMRALDWDVNGYQNSEILYVVSNSKNFDPLRSNIWEIRLFNPQKISKELRVNNIISIFKLSK